MTNEAPLSAPQAPSPAPAPTGGAPASEAGASTPSASGVPPQIEAFLAAQRGEEAPSEGQDTAPPAPASPPPGELSEEEKRLELYVAKTKRLQQERRRVREEAERNRQAIEQAKAYQELQSLEDPLEKHKRLGIDPNALIERMVQEGEKHRPLTVEERLERIEAQRQADIEAAKKAQEEADYTRHKQELDHYSGLYKNQISQLAEQNVDRYELINTYGQANRVWNKALDLYKENGKIPQPAEVMDAVETDLRNGLKKLIQTGYFQSLIQEYQSTKQPATPVLPKAPYGAQAPKPASLTNSIAKTTTLPKSEKDLAQEEEEQKQAKIMAMVADFLGTNA